MWVTRHDDGDAMWSVSLRFEFETIVKVAIKRDGKCKQYIRVRKRRIHALLPSFHLAQLFVLWFGVQFLMDSATLGI